MSAFWPVEVDALVRADPGGHRRQAVRRRRDRAPTTTRQTRHSAAGSDRGSPWTSEKSAGPPSREDAGLWLAEELAAAPRRGAERLPRLETGGDERLDLPGELVRPGRAAAEIGAGRDPDAGSTGRSGSIPRRARGGRRSRSRPSAPVNRSIVVVAPNDSHDRKTARVETRNVPRRAISAATSSSSSKPCSIASTPPATPLRAPSIRPLWAVTRAPRAWTAATTRSISATDHGQTVGSLAVEVELDEVGAVVELADRGATSASPSATSTAQLAERAGSADPRPGRPDVRPARPAPRAVANAEAERPLAGRRPGRRPPAEPTSRAQRTPRRVMSSALRAAVATAVAGGSSPRSIQCEPPGIVRWLWPSTMPGTIVDPPASTISSPSAGARVLLARRSAGSRRSGRPRRGCSSPSWS